jgi:hypothetical protein
MPDELGAETVASADERAPEDAPGEAAEEMIDLSSGADLTVEAAENIAAATLTHLILVAGEAESGKTTLLATIYEKFNEAPFANFLFAGSRTLVGWERRCHLARIASGAEKADTERTLGLQQRLLHIRVRNANMEGSIEDVVFTDLSGEVFKLIRDSTPECQQLGLLKRADHFAVLLDGKKLASAATRHEALNNSMALLRSCVDASMIGLHSFVEVVFSKHDLIANADHGTSEFLAYATETIATRFRGRLGRLTFHTIAARPESPDVEYAFGLSDLFRSWVEDSPYRVSRMAVPIKFPPKIGEFDNYLRVRFPELVEICPWKQKSN